MKLARVQQVTRFIVHIAWYILLLSLITGILHVFLCEILYQIFEL